MVSNAITNRRIEEVNRLDINLSQLQRNFKAISGLLKPGVRFMAVVKGNAYGHGLVPISAALESFGCHSLGVVRITEVIALREAGIKMPIVLLAPIMPSQVEEAVDYDATIMLDNEPIAYHVNQCAKEKGKIVKAHIKVNTGLNRFGVRVEEVPDYIRSIKMNCENIEIEGIYTHFRDPEFNKDFTISQMELFNNLLIKLQEEGIRPPVAHAAASGGILFFPEAQYEMVRCGILLYGEEYLKERKVMPKEVLPITSYVGCITKIIEVKEGQPIGYGDRYTAVRDCRIAVIGAGYGDGVSRGWKQVLVNGQKASVINYSMDCLEIDITDIAGDVREYDEAVIIGHQGGEHLTWEDACYGLNSEVDEQLQRITGRVPRNYFYEKKE